jgi:hypothetical protein
MRSIEQLKQELREVVAHGLALGNQRRSPQRDLAIAETELKAERLLIEVRDAERNQALRTIGAFTDDTVGQSASPLLVAMKAQDFSVVERPRVKVEALQALGLKSGSFDGTVGVDTLAQVVPAPPLGADQRFLYPRLTVVPVAEDTANVATYQQKARSLASTSDMIRDIDDTSSKPETSTQSQVVNLPLSQVATVSTAIPEILFANEGFAGWVRNDVELAWRFAIDSMVVDAITAAMPPSAPPGTNDYETLLAAVEAIAATGYTADVLVVSPGDALTLKLLQLTNGDSYVFPQNLPALISTPSVSDGGGFVLDSRAAGSLYSSSVTFTVLPENAGATNSFTARYENHAGFVVHRDDAICMLESSS